MSTYFDNLVNNMNKEKAEGNDRLSSADKEKVISEIDENDVKFNIHDMWNLIQKSIALKPITNVGEVGTGLMMAKGGVNAVKARNVAKAKTAINTEIAKGGELSKNFMTEVTPEMTENEADTLIYNKIDGAFNLYSQPGAQFKAYKDVAGDEAIKYTAEYQAGMKEAEALADESANLTEAEKNQISFDRGGDITEEELQEELEKRKDKMVSIGESVVKKNVAESKSVELTGSPLETDVEFAESYNKLKDTAFEKLMKDPKNVELAKSLKEIVKNVQTYKNSKYYNPNVKYNIPSEGIINNVRNFASGNVAGKIGVGGLVGNTASKIMGVDMMADFKKRHIDKHIFKYALGLNTEYHLNFAKGKRIPQVNEVGHYSDVINDDYMNYIQAMYTVNNEVSIRPFVEHIKTNINKMLQTPTLTSLAITGVKELFSSSHETEDAKVARREKQLNYLTTREEKKYYSNLTLPQSLKSELLDKYVNDQEHQKVVWKELKEFNPNLPDYDIVDVPGYDNNNKEE